MVSIKNLIKKYFKSEVYPENAIILANEIYYKVKNLIQNIEDEEEIVVTVDNEPSTSVIDCVIFSTDKIYICNSDIVKAIRYVEIEGIKLPKDKFKNGVENLIAERWTKVNDIAKLQLKYGELLEIRLICGGIYSLATLLQNSVFRKYVEQKG